MRVLISPKFFNTLVAQVRILSALFLTTTLSVGCGSSRPPITLDTSTVRNTKYSHKNFALLEIHNAWTGSTFGIPLGEALNESEYCTALITSGSEAITSTECLGNTFGRYDPKNMEVHLKPPGQSYTSKKQVVGILKIEEESGLVYLDLGKSPSSSSEQELLQSELKIKRSQLMSGLTATALGFDKPDKRGVAKLQVFSVTVNDAEQEQALSSYSEEMAPIDSQENQATIEENLTKTEEYVNRSHKIRIYGPATNTFGTTIFIEQKLLGTTRKDGASIWIPSI